LGGREAYHRYFDGVLERILPQVPGVRLVVAPCELTLIGDRKLARGGHRLLSDTESDAADRKLAGLRGARGSPDGRIEGRPHRCTSRFFGPAVSLLGNSSG
jgi:hypothetical protein